MAFTAVNPVAVKRATKVEHYDAVFNNTIALYAGAMAISGQAAGADIYAASATQLGVAAAGRQLRQDFRGMLRTSPDADKAAAQLYGDFTQAVFDDGTRIASGLSDLNWNMATAGLGGLDTGAEAASTWYQAYLIAKDDGTIGTLLHRAKDFFLDESQTAVADLDYPIRRSSAPTRTKLAQSFDTDEAGPIEFVDLLLNRDGAVASGKMIWVTLEADSAGSPSGTALATSDKLDASLFSDSTVWVRFPFRSPLTAVAGTTYWLVIQGDWAASDTVYIKMVANAAGGYAAGTMKSLDGGSWVDTSDDMNFKVYVARNDAAVTMPSLYTKKCLVGYVYNDGSSNFVPMFAIDRKVNSNITSGAVGTITATTETLSSLAAIVPPVPVRFWASIQQISGASYCMVGAVPDGYGGYSRLSGTIVGANAGNHPSPSGPVNTEFQACYLKVGANSADVYISGYEW